ncbi:uncharacterized protein LOC131597379 [Vicia villosa]|uniref:uncharacterized protein LOC131597379 n=1 Tax=Vicia villosa TaxID=3911 RepID=UPI00273C47DA|nr:uncharacterized protein LOC131597379 [Vicia villosa]
MKSSHLDSLGTNLMSKFSTDCTTENGHPTKIENAQHGLIFSTSQFYDPGSSSKNPINTEKKNPVRGRPKKHLGVPSLAMNLNSNPPKEAVNISVAQQPTSDSDEDSDYDPFATYLSDEDFCFEPEENEAPFIIHDNYTRSSEAYYDIGDPLIECRYCKSMMWYQEQMNKSSHYANPKFMLCCCNGKVEIPLLKQPPKVLAKLMFDHDNVVSRKFQQHIRVYNMMFAFTSPGAKLDNRFNNGGGPPTLRIQGQTCHPIGSLLPARGDTPKFAQLYIYDTENEVHNRMKCLRTTKNIDPEVVQQLSTMMYEHNTHAKSFKMAKQWFNEVDTQNLKLRLIADKSTDGRVYNQPTVSEVAALVVGDIDTAEMRDIIMQYQGGGLKRINELHASYMAFQYPLIFPYGEDGYRPNIAHRDLPIYQNSLRNRLTIREWLSYHIQTRLAEPRTLLSSRRLFQQFLVDGYTMLESEKLEWIRKNQPKLRVSKYNSLNDEGEQSQIPGSSIGKRVVLPSSFVGGRRFMDQLYYDGTAICSKIGFPDLFITFTCNPNWPEIHRVLGPLHLKPQDRPDVVSRIFKIKFDQLLADLTKNGVLGKVLACDLSLSTLLRSICMKDGKCSKYYPKKFQPTTIVDQDGYPVYRRRNNGNTIEKNGIIFHSGHVVPHNPSLLLKYEAYINMEWCNQSTSIKYLFKYINKGSDRISAVIQGQSNDANSGKKMLTKLNNIWIVDTFPQVRHVGGYLHIPYTAEN